MPEYEFNEKSYREAIRRGYCLPPGANSPFIKAIPARFDKLMKMAKKSRPQPPADLFDRLRDRLGDEYYGKLRGSVDFTLLASKSFFPAYSLMFDEFMIDEWLAMVDWRKFHRDHATHQSMTAYVGMSLLKGNVASDVSGGASEIKFRGGRTLLDICAEKAMSEEGNAAYLSDRLRELGGKRLYFGEGDAARALWKDMFLDAFFLAALFHDLGYPWKFVNIINSRLKPHTAIESPAKKSAEWLCERYGGRLMFRPLNGYERSAARAPASWPANLVGLVESALSETHGFPGAVSFLHLNDILRDYPGDASSPAGLFCVEWASMGIMMHDMGKIYMDKEEGAGKKSSALKVKNGQLRLSLATDPLSTVLTLADIIQDFARPNADFTSSGDDVKVGYSHGCEGVRLKWDEGRGELEIKYLLKDKGAYNIKKDMLPEEYERHFSPDKGFIDLTHAGVRRVTLKAELI